MHGTNNAGNYPICSNAIKPVILHSMKFFLQSKFLFLFLVFALAGCESIQNFKFTDSGNQDEYRGWQAKEFLDKAWAAMQAGNYQKSIKLYETLETRYPFGDYAAQAQLDVGYAYFKNDEPEKAIAAAERFIKINPRNPYVDSAYYLRGLVNYNRGIGFLDRFLPTDASQRNPTYAEDAYKNFEELIRRFPESQYVADSRQRMIALRNNLGMYEVHVARFYLKRKAYLAAANRAGHVVKEYQKTIAVPYALEIMQQAYGQLGLDDLKADAARVYQQNYPNGVDELAYRDDSPVNYIWDFFGLDQ